MTVNLLLVLLLHAKYNLSWNNTLVRVLEVQIRVQRK